MNSLIEQHLADSFAEDRIAELMPNLPTAQKTLLVSTPSGSSSMFSRRFRTDEELEHEWNHIFADN